MTPAGLGAVLAAHDTCTAMHTHDANIFGDGWRSQRLRPTYTINCFQKTAGNSEFWVLQTAHLAFLALGMWQMVMTGYAHHPQILWLSSMTGISVMFSGPIAFSTQLYTFSHKKTLPICCSTLVVTQFVITLMVSIATVTAKGLSRSWQWFIISGLLIMICADMTIMVSMSYYLRVNKADFELHMWWIRWFSTSWHRTIIQTTEAIHQFLIMPTVYIWTGLFIMESGLYTNSLLAFWMGRLNAHARFSHELQHPESADGLEVSLSGLDI
ncbi:hypothetical protein EDC04DRAFT_2606184 [Pisolithus marmoratus]|nr:hypothetical protein EDC04DRAFT_2606184 [Pisolithus marmoratus]